MELREIVAILYTLRSLEELVKAAKTRVSQVVFPQHFSFS